MSDNSSVISISMDAEQALVQTKALTGKLVELKKQQDETTKAFNSGSISVEEYSEKQAILKKQIEQTSKKLDTTRKALKSTGDKTKEAASALSNLGGAGALSAIKGIEGLNTAFKTLIANPIGVAITAIIGIMMKLRSAIAGNEEYSDRLQIVMAKFQPILNGISNGFSWLADKIIWVAENSGKLVKKILELNKQFNPFLKLLKTFGVDVDGIIDSTIEKLDNFGKTEQDLAKRSIALEKAKRDAKIKTSELEQEAAELEERINRNEFKG